ncbi:MAG: hypothetical protein V5A88_07330 [Candidatus Thermoplasmatota archaeon]
MVERLSAKELRRAKNGQEKKFPQCMTCKHRNNKKLCSGCDMEGDEPSNYEGLEGIQ